MLKDTNSRIRAQSPGGNAGRTVKLFIHSGEITVKTLGLGEKILNPSFSKIR